MKSHNSGLAYSVTILSTPTLIKAIDRAFDTDPRISLSVANISDSVIYIGYDTSLSTSNGFPLQSGEVMSETGYHGNLYGIVASSTAEVRVRYY